MNVTTPPMNGTLYPCPASELSGDQIGIAFALVIGAGAATCLGAAMPILLELPCCGRCRQPKALDRILAAGLAFAAGVMLYVSFVEIFTVKGVEAFGECTSAGLAYLYATLSFFGGIVIAWLLMVLVHFIQKQTLKHAKKPEPRLEVDQEGQMNQEVQQYLEMKRSESREDLLGFKDEEKLELTVFESTAEEVSTIVAVDQETSKKRLAAMAAFAGLAIAIHNFPEGLATFVAAAGDEGVGVLLAIAIAIHNIPEGMVVAIPIYHLTGSKWKAFFWGSLSGFTEPIGALLGWAVLGNLFTGIVYGLLFSLVAGMMVYISMRELLPMAHRYDPKDTVVTWSWVAGFAVMALSLVLFAF